MRRLEVLLDRRRLILLTASFLAAAGLASWLIMPRQEDPTMSEYWGLVITPFAGADAETVERLVLEPIEEKLVEVECVKEVTSTARSGVAIIQIELAAKCDLDAAWDDVREALRDARLDFPEEVGEPRLNTHISTDRESVVLAVTGSVDPLVLAEVAESLKRDLIGLPGLAKIVLTADPGEQITIEFDDALARRLGLDIGRLVAQLQARNQIIPAGTIKLAGRTVNLRPGSEFESLEEIAATPILLPSGAAVPLAELARVRRGPAEPPSSRMRVDGGMAVGLGLIPQQGVHVIGFGQAVRERLEELRPRYAPLEIRELFFQPDRVETRLQGLAWSLFLGILVVAAILVLAMGPRLGLLVSAVVPLVVLSSLAIFAMGGGVLHQISIAAMVIALGMLVDNALVMSENVQWRLDSGETPRKAALGAARELAVPLGGATATTLAAFVPMLMARGVTAEFTRSIPVVLMLTLTVSYLVAMLVTPVLSEIFLRRQTKRRQQHLLRLGSRLATVALVRSRWIVAGGLVLVACCLLASGLVGQRFFPSSDRNQLLIDLDLPEGAHLNEIDRLTRRVETALLARDEVVTVASFMGRGAPKFYYNIPVRPESPQLAQIAVITRDLASVDNLLNWTRDFVRREMPELRVVAHKLEQGPPVGAPVEVRLRGADFSSLNEAAGEVLALLREVPGAVDVRHDLGLGAPTVRFKVDDAAAGRRGLSRSDLALALLRQTRGLEIGQFRAGDDPVPIYLRSAAGEEFPVGNLPGVDITPMGGRPTPLAALAELSLEWRPAAIHHFNSQRAVTVSSQLAEGVAYSQVLAALRPRLAALDLPADITLQYGGEAEGSGEANTAMMMALPWGILLLLGILLGEFNSFRRVGIILVTVPLAAAGVVPGLLIADQPFGFMSLLGVIALVGIVVNNAIVLLDRIERRRREGASIADAVSDGVRRRIRPILLTTITTVAGLLPLALSGTTLWPPLAWAMISGLLASTVLTLVVVPAMYNLLLTPRGQSLAPLSQAHDPGDAQ